VDKQTFANSRSVALIANVTSITDTIIRDVLSRGIADEDIMLDQLGDPNQDMSLEQVFQFIEAKESAQPLNSRPHVNCAHFQWVPTKKTRDKSLSSL